MMSRTDRFVHQTLSKVDSTTVATVLGTAVLVYYALTPTLASWFGSHQNTFHKKSDKEWFAQAHALRLALDKPRQSRFRVVAIFVLEDGISFIPGTNDEPAPSISGAICAERCALLQWKLLYGTTTTTATATHQRPSIQRIYIVTDADIPIPPGMLCREYMYGHEAISATDTPILLQSANPESPSIQTLTLAEIYPHAPIYMGLSMEAQQALGSKLASTQLLTNTSDQHSSTATPKPMLWLEKLEIKGMNSKEIYNLWQSALHATQQEQRQDVHSISYGCAIAVKLDDENSSSTASSMEILSATQSKALEYGASIDAVCQILPQLQKLQSKDNSSVMALIQVDQWGIPHAPYAAARSLLVEHGWGEVPCIVSRLLLDSTREARTQHYTEQGGQNDESLEVYTVSARELAPLVPDFTKSID